MIQPVGWLIATIILLFVEASTFNLEIGRAHV